MSTLLFTHQDYLKHQTPPGHPERAERLQAVWDRFHDSRLPEKIPAEAPVPAPRELVEMVHRGEYVAEVESVARQGGGLLDPDTFVSPQSYDVALLAAGGAQAAVDAVLGGRAKTAMALVRPPGHHAESGRGMGFCLFNNAAVAAAHARHKYGLLRILLVDWDVHHGNGTQEIFYADRSVLYVSTHQEYWYPGTGHVEEIGAGDGAGFTLNIPLPAQTGDEGYTHIFEEVVLPLGQAFKPQLVIVSAGYDAHHADPLGGMVVTAAGFRTMAERMLEVARGSAEGRLVAVLEGGYDLDGLTYSVLATLEALSGEFSGLEEPPARPSQVPYMAIRERARRARSVLARHWNL